MIRLDFPGSCGARSLQPNSWNDWYQQFRENDRALLVQDTTSGGQKSSFNNFVNRETAADSSRARKSRRGSASSAKRTPARTRKR